MLLVEYLRNHQDLELAPFKRWIARVVIEEAMNSDEKEKSLKMV